MWTNHKIAEIELSVKPSCDILKNHSPNDFHVYHNYTSEFAERQNLTLLLVVIACYAMVIATQKYLICNQSYHHALMPLKLQKPHYVTSCKNPKQCYKLEVGRCPVQHAIR